ncbi:hypothetical protein MFIFM68171_00935 [Madurella fahalii]|uniref:Ankyrin n=1 Tax=Madurella fahalii TaxID=1157608 RepID=A0ABQ0FZG4_9PEZI
MMYRAAAAGLDNVLAAMLRSGCDINKTANYWGAPPAVIVAWRHCVSTMDYLLHSKYKPDLTATDEMGDTVLITAARKGNPRMIDVMLRSGVSVTNEDVNKDRRGRGVLLRHGADPNAEDGPGKTPLYAAIKGNHINVAQLLLEHMAKPDWDLAPPDETWNVCTMKTTLRMRVVARPYKLHVNTVLSKCATLLLKAGANAKFRNKNGDDAVDLLLRTASESDSDKVTECLRQLLSVPYSAPVDHVNDQGRTRLHGIGEKTPVCIVRLLVEAGASWNIQDEDGYTPLSVGIDKGNEGVAKYLIKQGANVNSFSPVFGSNLHLAVSKGALNLVELLVNSRADLETVNPEYEKSVLYTALGIADISKLRKMVRYLVDEAGVPINKLGGTPFAYPIIRAANLTRDWPRAGSQILKFLIRRGARLDAADSQGRRAVHLACTAPVDTGIRALAEAGAEIDVTDKFGRRPIHFAASAEGTDCLMYLLETLKDTVVDVRDNDNWTPLMWAARSARHINIMELVRRGADLWARGSGPKSQNEWSTLKLLNFADDGGGVRDYLEPKERTRAKPDGKTEEWDASFHTSKPGHRKLVTCASCLVRIRGPEWKCIDCAHDFSLCSKCYGRQSDYHDPSHIFEEIGPVYDDIALSDRTSRSGSDIEQAPLPEIERDKAPGNAENVEDHSEVEEDLEFYLGDSDSQG